MQDILEDATTYKRIISDTTKKEEWRLNSLHTRIKATGILSAVEYKQLYSSNGVAPRLTGYQKCTRKESHDGSLSPGLMDHHMPYLNYWPTSWSIRLACVCVSSTLLAPKSFSRIWSNLVIWTSGEPSCALSILVQIRPPGGQGGQF